MINAEDYFIAANSVGAISEEQYKKLDVLIHTAEAIARSLYQSVYVIDYYKKGFLYVSENPLFLCGHTAKEMKELGYSFYSQHVPEEEQQMLLEINSNGFKFFESKIADEDKHKCYISYDFHVVLEGNRKQVLSLCSQGLTMNEIADKMCKSIDSIKFYRRTLFEKIGTKNITEALTFATIYKLL